VPPKPVEQQATTPSRIERVRLNGNTIQQTENTPTQQAPEKTEIQNNPFSQQDLEKAWAKLPDKLADAYLKNAVQYVKPVLKDNFTVEIEVLNPEQASFFQKESGGLVALLAARLNNTGISLAPKVVEQDERQPLLYSDVEKLKYMAEKSPALVNLVQEFGLRLA